MAKLTDIRHPEYSRNSEKWGKWRLTYNSGQEFIDQYLTRFSFRESTAAFQKRKDMTYVPAFPKAAVDDIKNSIYQRTIDILRIGGSESYQAAIHGFQNGVDLLGSTMSYFVGHFVLRELLTMSRVGVYVDMPILSGPSKLDKGSKHPYTYIYPIEDILSWSYDQTESPNEFSAVLLRDNNFSLDPETNLPQESVISYRHVYLTKQGFVKVDFYDKDSNLTNTKDLNISRVPFWMRDIGDSLLAIPANYQIALMNIESSDINYIVNANFPFYVEQFDPRPASAYLQTDEEEETVVSPSQGRNYPLGTNQPAFIHPSSEPLQISIQKQEQMKRDIKILVNLAVSNLSPKMASAESKQVDNQGLEAGLSYIGLILENCENKIAEFWSMYESAEIPVVIYPTEYHLPNSEDVRAEITQYLELLEKINSPTARIQIVKRIIRRTIGSRISASTLAEIDLEIEKSPILVLNTLAEDLEAGLVDQETASKARGYPEGVVERAKKDQAVRLAMIQAAQTPVATDGPLKGGARGVPDQSPDPKLDAQLEKNGKPGRGPS